MKYWKLFFCLLLIPALLTGCSGKKPEISGEAIPLTEEEIAQVNEALSSTREDNGTVYATEVSCFFTSCYDRVEKLNFQNFLYYFPSSEYVQAEDREEFAALAALPDFPYQEDAAEDPLFSAAMLPVPIHRIREETVDAVLNKWAGITLNDIADKSGVLYLEDYHAFYTFTSDFGPGSFICTAGEAAGDTARLWSDPNGENGSRMLLTLKKKDGNWYISSFQTVQPAAEQ